MKQCHQLSVLRKALFLAAIILPISLSAQKKISTSPVSKTSVLSLDHVFKNYSVFSVDAPALAALARLNPRRNMDVEFDFAGLPAMHLLLEENDILSSDYKLITSSPSGRQVYEKPTSVMTYSGKLANDPGSKVYLTVTNQTVFGVIKTEGKQYYIEPLRYFSKQAAAGLSVVYEAKDVIPDPDAKCGSEEVQQRAPQLMNEMNQRATGTCKMVDVAIASDYSMLQKYSTAAIVQERNIGIMNLMVGIFREAQIGSNYLEFKVSAQYVAASAANDPYLPNYAGLDANILLDNFKSWGQANGFGPGVFYDMAQLWTARDFSGGVIGLAYIGGICNASRYQLLEDNSAPALVKASVAAHETGHNLNVQHDAPGSPYIMAPSISDPPYLTFSPASISTMETFITGPGAACLSSCDLSLVAQFSPSSNAACVGSSVNFTDYSVGGVQSRSWNFGAGASPAMSSNESVNVSYSTAGLKEITLTVTNGFTTASITKTILVSGSPRNCFASAPVSAGYGILAAFSLGDINMSKSTIYINRGEYNDGSCFNYTRLVPGATALATASIGTSHIFGDFYDNPAKLQVMLDYNNDGDFLDENELVYTSPECTQSVIQFPVSIPQWPPVVNQFLRLRVMALSCASAFTNGCAMPSNAQVYDFSIYLICTNTYYRDNDEDGYGDPLNSRKACSQPPGYLTDNSDCDDNNAAIKPTTVWVLDNDADGYYTGSPFTGCIPPAENYTIQTTQQPNDCNDDNKAINPLTVWIIDGDGDGFYTGSPFVGCTAPGENYIIQTAQQPNDCNDDNAAIHPNTEWIIDADLDGYYAASPLVNCTSPGLAYIVKTTQQQGDCADNDPAVNAGTTEVCANGKDDNCNGVKDEINCAPCLNATGLTTTNITANSAQLNWVAAANPLIWELRYKRTGPGSQWTNLPQMTGNIRSVTISRLVDNSTYNWQIRAKCGNAWTKYTDVVAFTTASSGIEDIITVAERKSKGLEIETGLIAAAQPNPSNHSFTLTAISDDRQDRIMLQVIDITGRVMETRSITSGQVIQLGENYKEGIYFVRFIQGKQVKQLKLIKF